MTAAERRKLLGESVAAYARSEGERAARECPPDPNVIAALRPILTASKRRLVKPVTAAHSAPMAA